MADERLYDYSKGLNAPIGSRKSRQKGTRLWYFATPMQLSFSLSLPLFCSHVALWRIHPGSSRKIHTLYFTTALLVSPL